MSAQRFVNLCRSQPSEVPTPPMPEGKRELIVDIFLRPDGLLRPGWRFLLYVLLASRSFTSSACSAICGARWGLARSGAG